MQRASEQFSDEQKSRIKAAVAEAESKTSAEIVPVVSTASGRYDRPEDIVGLWLALVGLGLAWWLLPAARSEAGSWAGGFPPWARLAGLLGATVVGFVLGAVIATQVGWLRRLFTPASQMRDEVAARARQVFFDSSVHHTGGGTGFLVYVSLYERTAAVLADQAVLDKLGQGALDELRDLLLARITAADLTDALCEVIRTAGEKLGEVLPIAPDDVNELPNDLVLLD